MVMRANVVVTFVDKISCAYQGCLQIGIGEGLHVLAVTSQLLFHCNAWNMLKLIFRL